MKKSVFIFIAFLLSSASGFRTQAAPADSLSRGGRYMFVPDSLVDPVQKILDGKGSVRIAPKFDPEEMTIVRGDTVPMVLKSRNLGRYDRGLFNYLFIAKGTWQFGLTAAYGEFNTKDLRGFDLFSDFDFAGHTLSIKPYVAYFFNNNMSLGLRLGYTDSKASLGSLSVDFDDDINFDLHDIKYRDEAYTAALMFRQYIGLARKGRFGVFNEAELAFSSGKSDFDRPYGGKPGNTHTTYMDARLTFSPGLCVFMTKNLSFNVSFGVFGFYLRNEKQVHGDGESSNRFSSGANFRFNIFNINFGLGVHI